MIKQILAVPSTLILLAFSVGQQSRAQDFTVTAARELGPSTFVGNPFSIEVFFQKTGGAAQFEVGEALIRFELPAGFDYEPPTINSLSNFSGTAVCTLIDQAVDCVATETVVFSGISNTRSTLAFSIPATPNTVGTFDFPPFPGLCAADPDNLIVETDEANNNCSAPALTVLEAPTLATTRWLTTSQWDDLMRIWDQPTQQLTNVQRQSLDGEPIHALNEIVQAPTGEIYVLFRSFQTAEHRLGLFDPTNGITDIGNTGVSFHDAAFADDGVLYAVGRDATLYQLDRTTGAPSALCDTGFGSASSNHSALAFDSDTDELLQIVEGSIFAFDLNMLPVDASQSCVTTETDLGEGFDTETFAADFANGQLFAVDENATVTFVARDGSWLVVGEVSDGIHGMIPDPGGVPVTTPQCLADAYVAINGNESADAIYGLDLKTGELSYLVSRDDSIRGLEVDPTTGTLLMTEGSGGGEQRVYRLDACTGQEVSSVVIAPRAVLRNLELAPDGRLFGTQSRDVISVDLTTGNATTETVLAESVQAFTIVGDTVRYDVSNSNLTTDLIDAPISDIGVPTAQISLDYGPIVPGSERQIDTMDAFADGSGAILALVRRVVPNGGANRADALPNVLARIEPDGRVIELTTVPATVDVVSLSNVVVFLDGFETGQQEQNR
ncbi:MAG: hypothetical protein AAF358_04875 [Pseudomonadota bacterium]